MKKDFSSNKDLGNKSLDESKNQADNHNLNYNQFDNDYDEFDDEYDDYYQAERFVKNSRNRKNLSKIPRRKDRSDW